MTPSAATRRDEAMAMASAAIWCGDLRPASTRAVTTSTPSRESASQSDIAREREHPLALASCWYFSRTDPVTTIGMRGDRLGFLVTGWGGVCGYQWIPPRRTPSVNDRHPVPRAAVAALRHQGGSRLPMGFPWREAGNEDHDSPGPRQADRNAPIRSAGVVGWNGRVPRPEQRGLDGRLSWGSAPYPRPRAARTRHAPVAVRVWTTRTRLPPAPLVHGGGGEAACRRAEPPTRWASDGLRPQCP